MSGITFKMTAVTNVGLVRTNNEDNFIVNPDLAEKDNWFVPGKADEDITLGKNGCVLVVADGMGGMNAGEVASELAVASVKESFSKVEEISDIAKNAGRIELFMKKVVLDADASIKERLKEDPSTAGMGTTIVVVWVLGTTAHVVWCGDSRAYLFNSKSGINRLTKDHSFVQELVDAGKLDAELAFNHPNSNIITRSLGDSPAKVRPDYTRRELRQDDVLLLCSDGLCGLCRDEEIVEVMAASEDMISCRDNLIGAALNAGGYDNVTVALMKMTSLGETEEAVSVVTINDQRRAKKRKLVARLVGALVIIAILAAAALVVMSRYDTIKGYLEKEAVKTEAVVEEANDSNEAAVEEAAAEEVVEQ